MTRLSPESEERDALAAIKAAQLDLPLPLRLDKVLRNKGGETMMVIRAQGFQQIRDQLAALGRQRFTGEISVILELEIPTGGDQPGLRRAVKGHIDLLDKSKQLVLNDDKHIAHLIVFVHRATGIEPAATMICTPLTSFIDDFDRAFRIANEQELDGPARPATFIDGQAIPFDPSRWGLDSFEDTDRELLHAHEEIVGVIHDLDAQDDEQFHEDPDADRDHDVPMPFVELTDWVVRNANRDHFERLAATERGRWLADQSIDVVDRPGGPPAWLEEVRARDAADIASADDSNAGTFWLPAPLKHAGTSGNWKTQVHAILAETLQEPPWRRARFPGPIALDIALRGDAATFKDVDNRAGDIIGEFERATAHMQPVLGGYRVYRLTDAKTDDIRVRILPEPRLRHLVNALLAGRDFVAIHRSERQRPYDP